MSEAAKAASMSVQEKFKAKRWTDSKTIARQATGVFLGGHSSDRQPGNPFKSEKQRRYMFAKHPKIARKWAHEK